jgi:hypothetical protein
MPDREIEWLADARGNPSRWVALAFSVVFGGGAVIAALTGEGYRVVLLLAFLFITCFNAAFGRKAALEQLVVALARSGKSDMPRADVP